MLSNPDHLVHQLRHVLLWPLQITPGFAGAQRAGLRDALTGTAGNFTGKGPWEAAPDEFDAVAGEFRESHYKEAG